MLASKSKACKPPLKDVPDVIYDSINHRTFHKGRFLGKGGFARCFELKEVSSKRLYAGKVVSKTLLVKPHQRDKVIKLIYFKFIFLF